MMTAIQPPGPLTDICQGCYGELSAEYDHSCGMIRRWCETCTPQLPREPVAPPPVPFIAFTGLAQSGKTTCANHLKTKRGYGILSFAAPLKRMLATLVPCHDKTAKPYVLCGRTVREAMQTLGTEWGRRLIGEDIWIRAARQEIERIRLTRVHGITCDDVRFDNEAELVKEMGGLVIGLKRPSEQRMEHASEAGISPALVDYYITAADADTLLAELDANFDRLITPA